MSLEDNIKTLVDIWELKRVMLKHEYIDYLGLSEEEADERATKRIRQIIINEGFDA